MDQQNYLAEKLWDLMHGYTKAFGPKAMEEYAEYVVFMIMGSMIIKLRGRAVFDRYVVDITSGERPECHHDV